MHITEAETRKELLIKPDNCRSLQEQVEEALKEGFQVLRLEGYFFIDKPGSFSMLTLTKNIEIVGDAILDGKDGVRHVIFVDDMVRVKISGITFRGGNTDASSVEDGVGTQNHPGIKLNVFRYLDGGAITMGEGSEVELEDCKFVDNHSAICAGAISNLGGHLTATNCRFEGNTCGDTGAAIDLLAAGSLAVLDRCVFVDNESNTAGEGTFGVVTAFPNTFLILKDCNFSQQPGVPVDFKVNKDGKCFISTRNIALGREGMTSYPTQNKAMRQEIVRRFARLFAKYPKLVKLQAVPKASAEIREKHFQKFLDFAGVSN